jgi:hypothetical protein
VLCQRRLCLRKELRRGRAAQLRQQRGEGHGVRKARRVR